MQRYAALYAKRIARHGISDEIAKSKHICMIHTAMSIQPATNGAKPSLDTGDRGCVQ
jgi:hypothetical protein